MKIQSSFKKRRTLQGRDTLKQIAEYLGIKPIAPRAAALSDDIVPSKRGSTLNGLLPKEYLKALRKLVDLLQ